MIQSFGDNYIELAGSTASTYVIDVYLPIEEMLDLKTGQSIVVVGQTTDEISKSSIDIAGTTFEEYHYQMPVAFLVKDTVELEGTLKGVNNSYSPAFNLEFSGNNVLKLIYFKDDVDTSSFEFGQKIKFSAKAVYESFDWRYYDAEIIE